MEEALNQRVDTAVASGHGQSSLSVTQTRCAGHVDGVATVVGTGTQKHQLPLPRQNQLPVSVRLLSSRGQPWVPILPRGDQPATWGQASDHGLPPSCRAR